MKYILTIDEGTTSVRATLFNTTSNAFEKIEQKSFEQIFPHPAWVEHDAQEILQKTKDCLNTICNGLNPKDILGLGITNQRETVVAFEKSSGKPLANAIVWQCRRTSKEAEKIKKSKWNKKIHKKTGLIPDAYFSATKIKWLLEKNENVKRALAENNLFVGTIETFLVYNLTGQKSFVTDVTNASRTMLFNIKTLSWDEELLKFFNIPKNILASIVRNDEVVGSTNLFLNSSIPIAGLIGDQQSSLFGQGCFNKNTSKNTYGTGCFMLTNTGSNIITSKHGLLTTIAFKIKNKLCYALEGSVFNAGSTINWAINNLNLAKSPKELTSLAYSIENNGGVYLVPAFTGLGTPYWNMDARALICGLTRGSDKRHISRAVLESIAYSTYDVFKTMEKDTKQNIKELHVDGGISENEKLMQFQSDILQINLKKYHRESTCLGAVFMTGLAVGFYKNLNDITTVLKPSKIFKSNCLGAELKNNIKNWHSAVKKCVK